MRRVQFAALLLCAAIAPMALFAADAGSKSGEKRELLKPPAGTIASPITDRLAVTGFFYMPGITTGMRYDSSSGTPGTVLSGEDTLHLDDKLYQGGLEFTFRMLERHRIRAEFSKLSRSSEEVVDQSILFGDNVYPQGELVSTLFDVRILGLSYSYSFFKSEKVELSAGLGLHLIQAEGELAATALFVADAFYVAGPFATAVFDGTWRVTPRFSLNLRSNYLTGKLDDVDGSYIIYHGDVQFRAHPNLAFGLGYSQTTIKFTTSRLNTPDYFNFQHKGPQAFVRVSY